MPNLSTPNIRNQVSGTGDSLVAQMQAFLKTQNDHNQAANKALNGALVKGDSLQILTPFTAAAPLKVPTEWQALTFQNSWVNTGGFSSAYRITLDGDVCARGNVSGGTANSIIATLPSALWPSEDANFATESNSAFGKVLVVAASGAIKQAAGTANLSLDCIRYRPAKPSPYVPSCFPFTAQWKGSEAPSLVIAECLDVSNAKSPSNLAATLPDWTYSSGTITVRNIPGLLPSTNYSVTLLCL